MLNESIKMAFDGMVSNKLRTFLTLLGIIIGVGAVIAMVSFYNCECCGEKTGANWIRLVGGKKLCLDCYESYNRFDV